MLSINNLFPPPAQATLICATLTGSDTARACGVVAHGNCPVLTLCRKLVAAGFDPDQPLEAWRGDVLALTVRSIGEAAELAVNAKGTGFIKHPHAVRTRSVVAPLPVLGGSPC